MTDAFARLQGALADRYAIERELGQGGMATVYLAEDLRHHRQVALKVLRPEIAVTVGAGRFAREIEVAARLQHPNILPLLDSGEADGLFFYVMPYVEGESLRDRLARGGELPVQDAVRILMEVADALSEAHAHGVVHRDIKPDNVMLRGRHALVADFGVAKAVTEATGQQLLTSTGVALGTPTYMAPEQAMADPHQDHRVDIYALGVLGYELLTGRAPFSATTAQEMLAAHVTAVPDPVEKYRAAVSPALAAVVMKCLAKKPADRWQTAEEVLQHLEPLATPSGGITPTATAPVGVVRNRRVRVLAVVAGAVGLVAVGTVAALLLRPGPLTITVSDIAPVTNDPGVEFQPAISPDGQEVAFVAGPITQPRLYVRSTANVSGGAAVRLADTAPGSEWLPTWSGDGQFVRFRACPTHFWSPACRWRETGKLGGGARDASLRGRLGNNISLAWSPDGSRVAFVVADTIFLASMSDTSVRQLAVHLADYAGLHSLAWSPDGMRIAYVNGNPFWLASGNVMASSIWIVDVAGSEPRRVTTHDGLNVSPQWLDNGHVLFVSNRDGPRRLYVVEVGSRGARGEPRAVPGVADPHSISYSIATRRLAYARFTLRQNIWAYPLGRTAPVSIGDGQPVTSGNQVIESHDVSPDGRWLAYDNNLRGSMDLYKLSLGGGPAVPLTDFPRNEFDPRWSPDGREIAFYDAVTTSEGQQYRILVMPAGGGVPQVLARSAVEELYPSWSPDGLEIAFLSVRTGRHETWVVSRDSVGGTWHEAAQLTDFGSFQFEWNPDGTGILMFDYRKPGGRELSVMSRDKHVVWRHDLTGVNELSLKGWNYSARYSRDGHSLYLVASHRDGRAGIWAMPAAGGPARLVIAFDDPALVAGPVSVGRDLLYLTVSEYDSDIWVAKLRY